MMEMVDAIEADYQSHTETILADGAYATGPNLEQAEARGTELLSPVRLEIAKTDNPAYREDLSKPVSEADIPRLPINATTKRFDRSAFVYDAEKDTYHCPAGKVLKREGTIEKVVRSRAGVAMELPDVQHQKVDADVAEGTHAIGNGSVDSKLLTRETGQSGRKLAPIGPFRTPPK